MTKQQLDRFARQSDQKDSIYIFDPIEVREWLEKQAAGSSEHSGHNDSASRGGQKRK